jgi:hypothetical protein
VVVEKVRAKVEALGARRRRRRADIVLVVVCVVTRDV